MSLPQDSHDQREHYYTGRSRLILVDEAPPCANKNQTSMTVSRSAGTLG